MSDPQEVSLLSFPLHLSPFTRPPLYRRLQQAYARGALRLVKRLHALLALAEARSVQAGAAMVGRGEHTVRDYRHLFLLKHLASLTQKPPTGRPSKWTTAQRRELADVMRAGPPAAGSTSGCWNPPMMQDLIPSRLGGSQHPPYLAPLLHHWGFSYQKACLLSEHLHEAKRLEGYRYKGSRLLRQARPRQALVLLGAEARLAQWGSLSSPLGSHRRAT